MARKRMFTPDVVHQDVFLDMPVDSQLLYFHLGLCADDDGFVSPKKVMRMVSSLDDNLKVLIAKGFVIPFPSGVVVIRHWLQNNFIRKDRYIPTVYRNELEALDSTSRVYQLYSQNNAMLTGESLVDQSGQPTVNLVSEVVRKVTAEKAQNVEEKKAEIRKMMEELGKEKVVGNKVRQKEEELPSIQI